MWERNPFNDPGTTNVELSRNALHALLEDRRRRDVLRRLVDRGRPVSLHELAERVAADRGPPSEQRRDRVAIDLHHVHLLKLADAGLVRYDRASRTVEALATAEPMRPLLVPSEDCED